MNSKIIALILFMTSMYGCKTLNVSLTPVYDPNKGYYSSELQIKKIHKDEKISELKLYDIEDVINGDTYNYWLLVPSDFENQFIFGNGFPLNNSEINSIHKSLVDFKKAVLEGNGKFKQYRFASNNSDDFIFIEGVIINEKFQVKLTFSSMYREKKELLMLSNSEKDKGKHFDALASTLSANSIKPNVFINDIEELEAFINLISIAK